MSRLVIHDVVIPIVERIISQQRHPGIYRRLRVRDSNLEVFLEEEMGRLFGVIGATDCRQLRERLEQAKKNDPYAFEFTVARLLEQYVKLATKIRRAERLKKLQEGPPDRFSELRRKYRELNRTR